MNWDSQSSPLDGFNAAALQLNRQAQVEVLKQRPKIIKTRERRIPQSHESKRSPRVEHVGQLGNGLKYRRLSDIVRPEQKIEPSEFVEVEPRKPPELPDSHVLHADYDSLDARLTFAFAQ